MTKPLPVGIEFYKTMIEKGYYYVDKTLMIRDILDSGAAVHLFTRPRRFGKTLALTMLKTFFEDERDADGNKIDNSLYFNGRKIMDCGEEYTKKQGQYPVVMLTLKSAKQPTWEMAYLSLAEDIADAFTRHNYVLQGDRLSEADKEKYIRLRDRRAGQIDYAKALNFLSRCLYAYHQRNVVILIDEYDVPLENAYFCGFYDEMLAFIRSFLESALKTNDCLELAVVTGCLRISRESIFTGLNNLKINSILQNDCAEYFGFTPEETMKLLRDYGMEEKEEEVRRWYDGYRFGDRDVYNPWSVANYASELRSDPKALPRPYWSNTSGNSIIRELVELADGATKREIESLLAGETIEKPVHEDITYGEIHESKENLWNFLFFTGYLKKISEQREERTIYLKLAVPNDEIAYIYDNTILAWFHKRIEATDRTPLYQALIDCNCSKLEETLKRLLVESISFYDEAEMFYHGFMAGMLSNLGDYWVRSNREYGDGRADIIMEPMDENLPVIILEFKNTRILTEMEPLAEAALKQIDERHYDSEHREIGYKHYIKYGICFCRKSCRVRGYRED
ncbi:MAG: ATP-binding protein [Blautia sp.]|nr:ATP-binding protein [Blautia sp.]